MQEYNSTQVALWALSSGVGATLRILFVGDKHWEHGGLFTKVKNDRRNHLRSRELAGRSGTDGQPSKHENPKQEDGYTPK